MEHMALENQKKILRFGDSSSFMVGFSIELSFVSFLGGVLGCPRKLVKG